MYFQNGKPVILYCLNTNTTFIKCWIPDLSHPRCGSNHQFPPPFHHVLMMVALQCVLVPAREQSASVILNQNICVYSPPLRWDGWMASPTQWTWVWVSSGSWWWTGKPGVLQFMGSQRVGHDWATELNWVPRLFLLLDFRTGSLIFKNIYLFGCAGSELRHSGPLVATYRLLVAVCGF